MYARITIIIISTRLPSNGEQAGNMYSNPLKAEMRKQKHQLMKNMK